MAKPNPELLLEQLKLLVETPTHFEGRSQEIIKLSRKGAVALEGPFETFQRLVYSVSSLPSSSQGFQTLTLPAAASHCNTHRSRPQNIPNLSREQGRVYEHHFSGSKDWAQAKRSRVASRLHDHAVHD